MPKTVVITGATSGMGKLLTEAFAEQGCKVFAGYRNVALKKELSDILRMAEFQQFSAPTPTCKPPMNVFFPRVRDILRTWV